MKLLSPFLSLFLISQLVVVPLQAQLPVSDPATPGLRLLLKSPTTALVNSQTAAGFVVEVTDAKGNPVPEAAVAFRLPDDGVTGAFADGLHATVVYTNAAGQAHSSAVRWGATPGSASLRITAVKGALHAGLLLEETVKPEGNVSTPAAPPIAAPQVVVVAVPNAPALNPPASPVPPLNHPAAEPGVLKSLPVTNSGAAPALAPRPAVSITNTTDGPRHSNKKWLILALIAVGAGVGAAMALKGKGAAAAPTTTATAVPPIGTPTVTVGH